MVKPLVSGYGKFLWDLAYSKAMQPFFNNYFMTLSILNADMHILLCCRRRFLQPQPLMVNHNRKQQEWFVYPTMASSWLTTSTTVSSNFMVGRVIHVLFENFHGITFLPKMKNLTTTKIYVISIRNPFAS